MIIVPTVNIAEEFYNKLGHMNRELSMRLCVNDNAFREFHKAVHAGVNVIITTYNTASKCLGDLIEEYYMSKQRLDYFLVIDEAHMLLQHIGLIEITKEFDKVALISATANDIKHFACFRDYIIVNPHIDERYNRNIYVNKLISDADGQRAAIVDLIDKNRMNYDKVLVKIEDKKECKRLKNCLKDRYKVALYTGDSKEVKLNEDGIFEEDVDVVISTSSIQNGQSIKENVLSIFVQTYIDTTSSVEQFLGRNRNRDSDVYVYVRYGKHMNKRKYATPNNRYERRLNLLRDSAWNEMSKTNWDDLLCRFGRVRFSKSNDTTSTETNDHVCDSGTKDCTAITNETSVNEQPCPRQVNESVNEASESKFEEPNINIEFPTKRYLYDYYGIDINTIPDGYEIKMRWIDCIN